jgi:hypothetical protein
LGGGISNRGGGGGFGSSGSGGGAEDLGGGGSEVQVVNFPLAISSSEAGRSYHRNALLFNVGLVLHQVVRSRSITCMRADDVVDDQVESNPTYSAHY